MLVFISGEYYKNDKDANNRATSELRLALQATGNKITKVNGMYKGIPESSFLVRFKGYKDILGILEIAKQFNQESILVVDGLNNAELVYCNTNKSERIGKWLSVDNVIGLDGYSEINGNYFTVKGE